MSFSFSRTVLIKSSNGTELVASQSRNSIWAWSDFFLSQFYANIRAGNILQIIIIFPLQWKNQSRCQNTHKVILKNELLTKTVIKLGPATSNVRNLVDFRGVRVCLSWLQTMWREKAAESCFLHFTVLGMLSIPFFMLSFLKGDHVQCQKLPPCLPGNNSWSLNKWSFANSTLISVVFITPCFPHVQDFLVSFLQRRS